MQFLSEGEQELMFCKALWAELLGHELGLQRPETAVKVDGALVIHAKSLHQLRVGVEGFSREFASLWVSSEAQLA